MWEDTGLQVISNAYINNNKTTVSKIILSDTVGLIINVIVWLHYSFS